jgi:hypothetical protein
VAYIESHQELATHPKVKRAARMLDVSIPTMIGHLHLLWWWAFDHAFDTGDLTRYDEYDIADAAMWDGDATRFVRTLIQCGSRGRPGFIDGNPVDNDTWRLHDWHIYTAAMRERREQAAHANHIRHHVKRGRTDDSCPFCSPPGLPEDSSRTPRGLLPGVPNASSRTPQPLLQDSTEPDLTEPDLPDQPPARTRDDDLELPPPPPKPKAGGDKSEDPLQHPVVTDLPAKHQRAIHNDTPQARGRLAKAITRANGIRTSKLKRSWDDPTALDHPTVKSIALTLAHRIDDLTNQEA